ncbi:CHAT domain-containing protein [Streptomyces phaeofaciens]|uniref:CHAT domain-containing protein n=1 Tax=Streptomyces phaeofaciens TaxID=68254 RepID=UPI001674302E|nr:CHAT domain-containing protein [Streptomyces phaeofaciens]
MAVDESGSVTPEDTAAEMAAAQRIALGDLSTSSEITIFGFASADRPGGSAVDAACPRITLDAAGRERIGDCLDALGGRERTDGTGTDLASAIRQGVSDLTAGTDTSRPRVLFLLTDGRMDVSESPAYGDPAHRETEGARQLALAVKEAEAQKVQIWPLGFGPDTDRSQLDQIAAGSHRKGCAELPSAVPKAYTVSSAKDIGTTLERMFAGARCLRHEVGPGRRPPVTSSIDVSPLATIGSIVVDKGDPDVRITYIDPVGRKVPASGTYKDSSVDLAGGSGTVETLRIVDPLPGTWRVRAEAPEGHRSLPVTVSALWQGELRDAIAMEPAAPQAGEKATVTVRLQTREGYAISDPRDYAGLRVIGELTGNGFSPRAIGLGDNGEGPDTKAGDGFFTGTVVIPKSAAGALKVSTTLTAPGLTAETGSLSTQVATVAPPVDIGLDLPTRPKSRPGGRIAATLTLSNSADTPRRLRLSLSDLLPELLSVTPDEIVVQPGERSRRRVTIQVAPADAFGDRLRDGLELASTLVVADITDGAQLLVQSQFSVPITPQGSGPTAFEPAYFALYVLMALGVAGVLAQMRERYRLKGPSKLDQRVAVESGAVLSGHMERHGSGERHRAWAWVDEPPAPSVGGSTPSPSTHHDLRPQGQVRPEPEARGTDGDATEPRWLVAELAEQTSPGREVPLHVQIVRAGPRGTGVELRSFFVPREGAQVLVTLHAPGLVVLDELQQELHVAPGRDSDVLLFRLKAPRPGLHKVTVRAYRGGTFLGEVTCQISVGHGSVTRDGPQRHAPLPSMAFDPGEVTLQVLRDETAGTFSFQLIGEAFHPPEIIHFAGNSRKATEQIYSELRKAARDATADGGEREARRLRDRLRNHGVQLWTSAVPQAVQSQFWDEVDRVTAFTVLGEHDIIPWELLYPLNEGREDRGFLAEWLPVVRRVFGQDRVRSLSLPGVAFVVPPGSPVDASMEVASLRVRLGSGVADAGVLTERAKLTALIEDGHAGLLHFACHNAFTGSGSCVTMADGPFDPIDLASAAQLRTLRPHRPLVFFNACRSAGEIDWFGESLGWAPQFLNAGAGAFVGTLWPVRSQSALQFAEAFYDELIANGQPLGHASLAARRTIRDLHGGDPTWLAYAVYGSPAATAHTTV